MEKLEKYIADLLWKHDCVVVPGFGGFVLNDRPAGFEGNAHELLPSGRRISFNRSLINNDGLLHHYIAQVTGQSFTDAQAFVATQVTYWKLQLQSRKAVTLAGIGAIQVDAGGRWQFTPADITGFDKKTFGMVRLQLVPLEAGPSVKLQQPQRPGAQKASAGTRNLWVRTAAAAGTLAAALFLIGFLALPQFRNNPPVSLGGSAGPEISVQKPAPVTPAPGQQATGQQIADAVALAHKEIAPPEPVNNLQYYIIGGSFASERNAKRFKAALDKKGYSALILDNENGFFRVAYINETDSLAATRALKKIKIEENQEAWLLKW